ncbi:MAG: hypothetical protein ABW277_04970 [Longimicrobiaceae bacterium]
MSRIAYVLLLACTAAAAACSQDAPTAVKAGGAPSHSGYVVAFGDELIPCDPADGNPECVWVGGDQ